MPTSPWQPNVWPRPRFDSQTCYEWTHQLLFSANHPLVNKSKPKITILPNTRSSPTNLPLGRAKIDKAFGDAHMRADVVLEAVDADVIKTYVELGLGVGICGHGLE